MLQRAGVLLLVLIFLSACQLDAGSGRPVRLAGQPQPVTPTPPLSTATPTFTLAPTVAVRPSRTPTPPPTPTPTNTPTITSTPVPSDRLAAARRAYAAGKFEVARQEFDRLLNDPGADAHEIEAALYWRGRAELDLDNTESAVATLQSFLRQYPTHPLARAAQFNLARAYQQSGQTQTAINAYLGTLIPDDPVNVYIYQIIGDLHLRTGHYTDTITAYRNGIESTDDVGFQVHLGEGIAQAELRRGSQPEAAINEYQSILSRAKIPSYRAKILRLQGDAYQIIGDEQAAIASYRQAVDNYPTAANSYLALVELVNRDVPVDDFQRGLIDYHASAYQPAIAAFDRYLMQVEESPPVTATIPISATAELTPTAQPAPPHRADEALWLTGLSHKLLGRYNGAIFAFQELIDSYPASRHWAEAHLQIGRTRIEQGNHTLAKSVLWQFAAENPDHPLAAKALWRAARLDMSDEIFDDAYTQLRALAKKYPASDYADDALYWAGQAAYLQDDFEDAVETWSLLAQNYPVSELASFGGYWHGRALLQLGREAEANQLFAEVAAGPTEYYRLRARDRLAESAPAAVLATPTAAQLRREQVVAEKWLRDWLKPEPPANLRAIGANLQTDSAFLRGDGLLQLGLRREALAEFEAVKNRWQDDPLTMYQLALYFGDHHLGRLSILASGRLVALSPAKTVDDAPLFIQQLYYPLYFEDVIFEEAENLGVEPALVAALIRQESLFEPTAESGAGARGLMQVMPGTGEYVAQRSDYGPFTTDALWLPYINIKFGAWYINQQLGIFDNNLFAAMAAYNAGPGNVLNWVETTDDPDTFVETIPFWESRTYIRRVYENLAAYQRIYGQPVP